MRHHRSSFHPSLLGALAATSALTVATGAGATDPLLRHQQEVRGDVVVFGSTLGFDCGAGVLPASGTASCAAETNTTDTAPDLYWRDGIANASISATQARTSATLSLPAGAKVTYARLYWAALKDGATPDANATLDFLGGPQQAIDADQTWVIPYSLPAHPDWYYYQSSGDATNYVTKWGAGDFRVSDVESLPLAGQGLDIDRAFSAWTLVVFYEKANDELRNLALFDGFTAIDPGLPGQGSAEVTLSGFLTFPGFSARMSAIAYEGDSIYSGDHFTVNGSQLTDALNPSDNFFNSSRTFLGQPVSGNVDVPRLTGAPGSMAGYDLDTVDVTSHLSAGDTTAQVGADSTKDIFFLGGFVTSVASLAPDFTHFAKTVEDLNGGAVLSGDILEYTLIATNEGNDPSKNSRITDTIQPGLEFVPGSIEILEGGNDGLKTDASGDDQGEFDAGQKLVTIRVGAGATASQGGSIPVNGMVKVRFQAKVTATDGPIENQADIFASGEAGALEKKWSSDADPDDVGSQPTVITVDECNSDAECSDDKPHCDLSLHACVGCSSDADCTDPAEPACQPSGACGQCSQSNKVLCNGDTPACNTSVGICVLCTLGPNGDASKCVSEPDGPLCVAGQANTVHCGCLTDSDCGGPNSGKVCDAIPQTCVDGCRGEGGNGCPVELECSSKDSSIGDCGPGGAGGGGAGGSANTGGSGGAGGALGSTDTASSGGAGGSAGGAGGSGGSSAVVAAQGDPTDPGDTGGCACTVPADSTAPIGRSLAAALAGLALWARRRRSPSSAKR
jgi:fimbrial isopeptide formation D2 family protein/MYXO-CTERM domain-containing protein